MALSFFTDVTSLSFSSLAELQQFKGTEAEMLFPDPSAFSRTSEIAQERAKQTTNFQLMRCITGLFGGTAASFLSENPLPLLIGLSECFPRAYAQQKVGNEFQVNTYTTANQIYPSVATFDNGNFVVTWASYGQDGPSFGIFAQLFNGNGSKFGSEFQVNSYTANAQQSPSVATFSNDNFVVTWQSLGQDGSQDGVYGQLFNENGAKIRGEFRVNTFTGGYQYASSTATFKNDNFVVTWTSDGQGGGPEIYGQLFYGNGTKIGGEFHVNTYTSSNQEEPSVATLSNDNFIVTWESEGQDGDGYGIYGQLFNNNATKIGNEFRVNNFTTDGQYFPSVATFRSDNFVVTWDSSGQDGSGFGIFGQLFHENTSKLGREFQVNAYATNAQRIPAVATFSNGNFVVTWHSGGNRDGHNNGVFGQLFSGNGTKIGREFQANTFYIRDQKFSSVATFKNNQFMVTWQSDGQGTSDEIYGQIFHDNITYPSISTPISSSTTSITKTTSSTTSSVSSSTTSVTTTSLEITSVSSKITASSTTKTTSSIMSSTTTSSASSSTTVPSITRSKTLSNNRTTLSVTSNPNNHFLWLWLLLGIGGGTTCLGLTGYFLLKKRKEERANHTSPLTLTTFSSIDPERNLSDRAEKGHTRIGGKYDLINKISREEAQTLLEQTGILVEFPDRQYRTKVLLGKGNFGKLRIACLHGRYLGVKKIKGEDEIAQSRSEGRLQAKLSGKPNIMPILDFVESESSQRDPVLYQFMPLAGFGNGGTLRDHLQTFSDPARKEQILTHVAKGLLTGLSHMHEAHIYHLDIKPSNMVIDIRGKPFIIDFGCAQELPEGLIQDQMTGDTEYYSPERIRFYQQVSKRQQPDPIAADKIDAWALGVTLLEIVLGYYPFDRTGFFAKIRHWDNAYFQEKLDEIPLLKNPNPGSLLSIVKGLLDVDPQKRLTIEEALAQLTHTNPFSSTSEQQTVFADLKQQKPSAAASPASSAPRNEDERYADVCIRKYGYGFTPDSVAPPEYEWTPDFVHQASSAVPPSAEEVMRLE